jgi:hypothetical protein
MAGLMSDIAKESVKEARFWRRCFWIVAAAAIVLVVLNLSHWKVGV